MNDSDWFEYVLTMGKHFVIVCNFKKNKMMQEMRPRSESDILIQYLHLLFLICLYAIIEIIKDRICTIDNNK